MIVFGIQLTSHFLRNLYIVGLSTSAFMQCVGSWWTDNTLIQTQCTSMLHTHLLAVVLFETCNNWDVFGKNCDLKYYDVFAYSWKCCFINYSFCYTAFFFAVSKKEVRTSFFKKKNWETQKTTLFNAILKLVENVASKQSPNMLEWFVLQYNLCAVMCRFQYFSIFSSNIQPPGYIFLLNR
jgi:hypothetical protein